MFITDSGDVFMSTEKSWISATIWTEISRLVLTLWNNSFYIGGWVGTGWYAGRYNLSHNIILSISTITRLSRAKFTILSCGLLIIMLQSWYDDAMILYCIVCSWSVAAILNFSRTLKKITCTSPYGGECDFKMWIISDFKFLSFCAHKKLKLIRGGHFEYQ